MADTGIASAVGVINDPPQGALRFSIANGRATEIRRRCSENDELRSPVVEVDRLES